MADHIDTEVWRRDWASLPMPAVRVVAVLCDEIDRLRVRLDEAEAELSEERDHAAEGWERARHLQGLLQAAERGESKQIRRAEAAEARLAEVEAERDELATGYATQMSAISDLLRRIRAVEEVCDAASGDHIGGVTVVRVPLVRAAAAGDDREAADGSA